MNALTQYRTALHLLAAARKQLEEIATPDAMRYANAIDELITCDHDEAGLRPFIERMTKAANKEARQ